jgi:acetylglutamate kinase
MPAVKTNVLIKIGGTLLDAPESRNRLAGEIGAVVKAGTRVVVVHGGGKQVTSFLTAHGVESRFINGLRVTTPEVLDAVLKVLAGSVNRQFVGAFIASGASAVGLTGMDALVAEAEPLSEELGAVGKPTPSSGQLLNLLLENGYLPVIACLAGDRQGRFYNVNADQMAAAVAESVHASKVFFLTDVDGVKDKDGSIIPELCPKRCRDLIEAGVATGGMQAKLEAAVQAVRQGVEEVRIVRGSVPGVIRQLLDGARLGTCLVSELAERAHGQH